MYEGIVQDLIDELGRLPGVGPKSAQRIAFHLLQADPVDVRRLADVLIEVKARVKFCSVCFNVSEDEQCRICRDPRRDPSVLCVVEEYKDVVAIERTREFRGRYHVLGGAISPIDGLVTVTVNGTGELVKVKIRRDSFDPSETEDLEDLIVAAYRDAKAQADALAGEALGPLAGGGDVPGQLGF